MSNFTFQEVFGSYASPTTIGSHLRFLRLRLNIKDVAAGAHTVSLGRLPVGALIGIGDTGGGVVKNTGSVALSGVSLGIVGAPTRFTAATSAAAATVYAEASTATNGGYLSDGTYVAAGDTVPTGKGAATLPTSVQIAQPSALQQYPVTEADNTAGVILSFTSGAAGTVEAEVVIPFVAGNSDI
jgi:hypothetical protein